MQMYDTVYDHIIPVQCTDMNTSICFTDHIYPSPVFNEWLYDTLTFWSSTNLAAAFWNSGFAFLQCPHPAKKIK